jgi:hypothetical protein
MKDFYYAESAFMSMCITQNLLSLFQNASSFAERKLLLENIV